MSAKSLKNSFYCGRKGRRFGWFSVTLAIIANLLIFFLVSWVNRTPKAHRLESYAAIELFKPQLIPENILPQIDSMPVIAETKFQPKPEPMKLTPSKENLVRPRLIEWMPDSLLNKPGVALDISLTEISSPDLMDGADFGNALALNQVDQAPRKISGASPAYPFWAKAKSAEGTVTLRFIVDIDGKPQNIEVHSIRGDQRFAITAREAVEKWRFTPAINRGKPTPVWCFQKIQFQFED